MSENRLGDSERWATLRQESRTVSKSLYDYFESRGIEAVEHNAHGLYFDVQVGGKALMIDASADDLPYEFGLVVVRDDTHHYERPTRVGSVNILTEEGRARLDELIGYRPNIVRENIKVVCADCTLSFITSLDSFESGEVRCPACKGERITQPL